MNFFAGKNFKTANLQAADVVLESSINFLLGHGVSKSDVKRCVNNYLRDSGANARRRAHIQLTRSYEEMGSVLSTWFDCPSFLNQDGTPTPISIGRGTHSLRRLLKTAKVGISTTRAIELLRLSPSVHFNSDSSISALRRVFVLKGFELSRAALVIPRYFDTLSLNSAAYKNGTVKLLERQCSVSRMEPRSIMPILRRIREQGGAFVDSIDGEIEKEKAGARRRRSGTELGLLVFAWTKAKRT